MATDPMKSSVSSACVADLRKGLATEIPPNPVHVRIYFDQQELPQEAVKFHEHQEQAHWKTDKGRPLKNWKTAAAQWIWALKLERPYLRFK